MKSIIKILTLVSLLHFVPILSMEEVDTEFYDPSITFQSSLRGVLPKETIEENDPEPCDGSIIDLDESSINPLALLCCLPNELRVLILLYALYDADVFNDCNDIYETEPIEIQFSKASKAIRLICKTFDSMVCSNKVLLKDIYRAQLTEKFLERRDKCLYPIGGTWGLSTIPEYKNKDINENIAHFLTHRKKYENIILEIFEMSDFNELSKKIISLMLFYGANAINRNPLEETVLHFAMEKHGAGDADMRDIIRKLLAHGAHVNAKDNFGKTALDMAVILLNNKHDIKEIEDVVEKNGIKEIINILLVHKADHNALDDLNKKLAIENGIDFENPTDYSALNNADKESAKEKASVRSKKSRKKVRSKKSEKRCDLM